MKRTLTFCCVAVATFAVTSIAAAQSHNVSGWPTPLETQSPPITPVRSATSPALPNAASSSQASYRLPAIAPARLPLSQQLWNVSENVGPPLQQDPGPQTLAPAQADGLWNPYAQQNISGGKSPHICSGPGCCGAYRWIGSVGGLYMTRDSANNLWLSYDQFSIADRVLNSNNANFGWGGGAQASLSRYFNCGRNAIQLTYWGIYPNRQTANAFGSDTAGGLDSILHFDGLSYDPGTGNELVSAFFFNAERHRVQRNYQVHNVEVNLLGNNFCSPCCGLRLGWLAGVRYLRFDDDFLYSGDRVDNVFDGNPEEVHYGIGVQNNLIGFQVGGRADYCFWNRFNTFAVTKVGLFGNHISHHSAIYGSNGSAFVSDPASPYVNQDMNISSTKNDVAFVAELNLGVNYQMTPCWSVGLGYRALGITGAAVSTSQVPVDFIAALPSVRSINSNDAVILHGGFLNVTYAH